MSREAIEEAIEVLEDARADMLMETGDKNYYVEAIAVLRQALETEKQWVGLTKEDMPDGDNPMFDTNEFYAGMSAWHGWVLREVLFDNGEPIGHREPEQKPVAWMFVNEDGECEQIEYGPVFDDPDVTPLYTAPPKREWVGLTAYEIQEIYSGNQHWGNFASAIEAKLKEKNHG